MKKKAFFITMFFFMIFLGLITVNKKFRLTASSDVVITSWQREINEINQKIQELEAMKRGYEAKVISHSNKAERLQFINGELQTAKRYWKLADENQRIVVRIQQEIDDLKVQKQNILKKHNQD